MAQSQGDARPDEARPAADLATAAHQGRRVARTTAELLAGRVPLAASRQPTDEEQQAYVRGTTYA